MDKMFSKFHLFFDRIMRESALSLRMIGNCQMVKKDSLNKKCLKTGGN